MSFDLTLAEQMAVICQAAYDDDFAGYCDAFDLPVEEIQELADDNQRILVGHYPDRTVVAFRGTATVGGWEEDLNTAPVLTWYPGLVHAGFYQADQNCAILLDGNVPPEKPVLFTGHSLGGALATLASYRYLRRSYHVLPVYTFGCPRVGNPRFVNAMSELSLFRVTYAGDPVPHVPLGVYAPHGTTVWYNPAGEQLPENPEEEIIDFARDVWSDHAIANYVRILSPKGK
jgi:hypothetical protein